MFGQRNCTLSHRDFIVPDTKGLNIDMNWVTTPQSSRIIDNEAIASGIAPSVLMETAAQGVVSHCADIPDGSAVVVLCGNGNNGGDGYAIARMLSTRCTVTIGAVPEPSTMSAETLENYHRALQLSIPVSIPDDVLAGTYDVVIDALIGTGGTADLREPISRWTRLVNSKKAYVLSVDVPTGLDSATGRRHPDTVRADTTITMETIKLGMLTAGGREVCGTIHVVPIGAPPGLARQHAIGSSLDTGDLRQLLPERRSGTHKYTYGHVLVVAGNRAMRGAAALCAEAALRTGAGVVTLATDHPHPLLPREIMVVPLNQAEQMLGKVTTIVAGPGFGTDEDRLGMLTRLLNNAHDIPRIIDADGLRCIPEMRGNMQNCILTPHPGEFNQLCDALGLEHASKSAEITSVVNTVRTLASHLGCTVHLKSVPPVTVSGSDVRFCSTGNPALATAGTGDVLAGMIAGLVAQGVLGIDAASLGAYLHGLTADVWVQSRAEESMLAGDVIRLLGTVMKNNNEKGK